MTSAQTGRDQTGAAGPASISCRNTPGDASDLMLRASWSLPFFWPFLATAVASGAAASLFADLAHRLMPDQGARGPEPGWATAHVTLELPTMQLRDFSRGSDGPAALVCAPYALHGALLADFASSHSLVEALLGSGIRRVSVTAWRSATPDMRFLPIDAYLADLNVVVDELGPPVDLIGLCHGGLLALIYAARFPAKVGRLVLAGVPVDVKAAPSTISRLVDQVPLAHFEEIVRLGDGRVLGQRAVEMWAKILDKPEATEVLQLPATVSSRRRRELEERFQRWYDSTLDLPGTYYLQTVSWLFKENRLAAGRFLALGRMINLRDVRGPVFLLAARDDEVVSAGQLLATAELVGTRREAIKTMVVPGSHLGLFMGAQTLRRVWPRIARWLGYDAALAHAA